MMIESSSVCSGIVKKLGIEKNICSMNKLGAPAFACSAFFIAGVFPFPRLFLGVFLVVIVFLSKRLSKRRKAPPT
jgi:hypothetical protein